MSAIGTDPSLATLKDEELRKEMEKLSARNKELEEELQEIRKSMDVILRELSRIKMLEMQVGRAFNSLGKKRAYLEETLTKALHSFGRLAR